MIAATKTWLGSPFCWLLHIIVSPSYLRLLRPFIYICIYIYVYHSQLQTLKPPEQQCRDASRSYRSSRRRFLSRLKTSPSEHWHLKIMGDSCVQRLSAILFVSLRGLNPINPMLMGFPRFPPWGCGQQPLCRCTILVWQFQKTMGLPGNWLFCHGHNLDTLSRITSFYPRATLELSEIILNHIKSY